VSAFFLPREESIALRNGDISLWIEANESAWRRRGDGQEIIPVRGRAVGEGEPCECICSDDEYGPHHPTRNSEFQIRYDSWFSDAKLNIKQIIGKNSCHYSCFVPPTTKHKDAPYADMAHTKVHSHDYIPSKWWQLLF
jgi:hypothetical protein